MKLFERIAVWFESRTVPTSPEIIDDSVELNPATGLPTIAGAGTPDIAGNPYGSAWSNNGKYGRQRHDCWDVGIHRHFHHHYSWSASSRDPWCD